jgi:hypothetical protein
MCPISLVTMGLPLPLFFLRVIYWSYTAGKYAHLEEGETINLKNYSFVRKDHAGKKIRKFELGMWKSSHVFGREG